MRRGLTLVEILAVVVVLGLIAGVTMIGFSGTFRRARHEVAKSHIERLVAQVETYYLVHRAYPDAGAGLAALAMAGAGAEYYVSEESRVDPWGRAYLYIAPGPDGRPYEIVSFGEDGQPGGTGANGDLSSARLEAK